MQPHPNAPPPGLRVHTFLASRVVTSPCFLVRVRLVCAQAFAEYGVTSPQDIEELLFTDDVHEALAFITDGLTKDFEMDKKEMAVTRLGASFIQRANNSAVYASRKKASLAIGSIVLSA